MVFSSFPVYLDHPNLHQFQQQQEHQQGSGLENNTLLPPPPPPQPLPVGGGVGGGSSIRPGSMVDRARLAKLPLPEAGLKCPRCDSTNTKFCYFNNYNLSQPRHFCKTCRRYWTRGGALRNVPVGGGCRRNKKSKSSGSKSSITANQRQIAVGGSNNSTSTPSPSSCSADMAGHNFPSQTNHQLPLMAALTNLNHYGGGHIGGFQSQIMATTAGNGLSNMGFNDLSAAAAGGGGDHHQWRLPSVGGFDQPPTSLFPLIQSDQGFEGSSNLSMLGNHQQLGSLTTSSTVGSQIVPVKSEENQGLNLTKQFLLNSDQNNQFWVGNPWTGFSGLNSSSTSHLL
ncbi:hypothetical protein ACH5RR_020792 [Cinchona calisaya]|uniref:Dof zinc finger protein n=1 Tax=Cinchona calisaya TaxID=153742 RepID=A0ABD2ZFK4_9GENT